MPWKWVPIIGLKEWVRVTMPLGRLVHFLVLFGISGYRSGICCRDDEDVGFGLEDEGF